MNIWGFLSWACMATLTLGYMLTDQKLTVKKPEYAKDVHRAKAWCAGIGMIFALVSIVGQAISIMI